jgi:hypothetical protein
VSALASALPALRSGEAFETRTRQARCGPGGWSNRPSTRIQRGERRGYRLQPRGADRERVAADVDADVIGPSRSTFAAPQAACPGGAPAASVAYRADTTTFAGMVPGQSGSVRTPGVPGKWGRSSPTPWKPRPTPLSLAVETRGPTHEGIDGTLRDARLALQRCVGRGPIRHFPGSRGCG